MLNNNIEPSQIYIENLKDIEMAFENGMRRNLSYLRPKTSLDEVDVIRKTFNNLNQINKESVLSGVLFDNDKAKELITKNYEIVVPLYSLFTSLNLTDGLCPVAKFFSYLCSNEESLNKLQLSSYRALLGMETIIDLLYFSQKNLANPYARNYLHEKIMIVWNMYTEKEMTYKINEICCLNKMNYIFSQSAMKDNNPLRNYVIKTFNTFEKLKLLKNTTTFGYSKVLKDNTPISDAREIYFNIFNLNLPTKYLVDTLLADNVSPSEVFNFLADSVIDDDFKEINLAVFRGQFSDVQKELLNIYFHTKQTMDIENFSEKSFCHAYIHIFVKNLINIGLSLDENNPLDLDFFVKIMTSKNFNHSKTNHIFGLLEENGLSDTIQSDIILKLNQRNFDFSKTLTLNAPILIAIEDLACKGIAAEEVKHILNQIVSGTQLCDLFLQNDTYAEMLGNNVRNIGYNFKKIYITSLKETFQNLTPKEKDLFIDRFLEFLKYNLTFRDCECLTVATYILPQSFKQKIIENLDFKNNTLPLFNSLIIQGCTLTNDKEKKCIYEAAHMSMEQEANHFIMLNLLQKQPENLESFRRVASVCDSNSLMFRNTTLSLNPSLQMVETKINQIEIGE